MESQAESCVGKEKEEKTFFFKRGVFLSRKCNTSTLVTRKLMQIVDPGFADS